MFVCMATTAMAQNYKFGKVSERELQEQFHPSDSSASAAYLYRNRYTHYNYIQGRGFEVVTEVHERIKIYNKDGFKYATKKISFFVPESGQKEKITGLKAYSFNLVEGSVEKTKLSKTDVFEEKLSKYRHVKKITMPNIKEGTVIELKYTLRSPYERFIDDLKYQYDIPVKKISYKIAIPEFYKFNKRLKGYYHITPKESNKNSRLTLTSKERVVTRTTVLGARINRSTINYKTTISEYEAENIPALKDNEPFVSNVENYRGGIQYELSMVQYPQSIPKFYSTNWKDVSKQIYRSPAFGGELSKTGYFKKDLEEVIAGETNGIKKAIKIFLYVKSKMKWNGYYGKYVEKGTRKAYKEGVGNIAEINLMLTAMLKHSKLNASPVLVSTKNNGIPLFATSKGFNYVISMVEFPNGGYMLLDASDPNAMPNILPTRALNWNGRKVMENGLSSWVNLIPNTYSEANNNLSVKINEDLSVSGLSRANLTNYQAVAYRKENSNKKDEAIIAKLEEDYEIEIENFRVGNKKKLGQPVSQLFKFSSEDEIEEINGKLYCNPLLFLANTNNPFKSKERKFPVDFGVPMKHKYSVSIQIPTGYKVESVPQPLAIGLPNKIGVFKYQVKTVGNKVTTLAILQISKPFIAPQHYGALKDFYKQMVERQAEKIVLIKE